MLDDMGKTRRLHLKQANLVLDEKFSNLNIKLSSLSYIDEYRLNPSGLFYSVCTTSRKVDFLQTLTLTSMCQKTHTVVD